ncbi:MAG: thiamine ABC transporter substrate-binding protein [bacterium]
MKKYIVTLFCVAAVFSGCAGSKEQATKKLTLLAYDSFLPTEGIFDEFTKETGISVEVILGGDTGQLISKAILTSGNPEGDVLWGVDNTFLTRAIKGEIFAPYTSPLTKDMAADVVELTQPEGVVTPVDTGDVCINYDKKWFSQRNIVPPQSLEDLALPAYKDLLVVQNPASSSPGLAFLLSTIAAFGEDDWQSYWKKLRTNGVKVVDGWTEAYTIEFSGSSGKGTRPLVVSYASSPPAEVVYSDPPVSEPPTAVIDTTCFHQVEFAGILRGSKNDKAAQLLIDYLADTTFQSDLPLTLFVNPVNKNVALPDVFTSFAAQPEKPYTMDPAAIEKNRVTWVDTWSSIALR